MDGEELQAGTRRLGGSRSFTKGRGSHAGGGYWGGESAEADGGIRSSVADSFYARVLIPASKSRDHGINQ